EADAQHANALLEGLDHLVVQDILFTRTAEMADVVLPASASWCEAEGTVTNSERRVQRVRKALDPPGQARDDIEIICELGRRLGPFTPGVQSGGYRSPLRRREALQIAPEDGTRYGVAEGERVRVVSRRGAVEAPIRYDDTLRPGLAFMTLHFPDEVETNVLTIDATDPKPGPAEFKA